MKVTNWRRKLMESLVAAGVLIPSASYAVDIPLLDPSFEVYTVPSRGYAYATGSLGAYRPTSPWIANLDSPPGFPQDGGTGNSNWLYNSNYAEVISTANKRPAPKTGNQAMHGLDGQFNAQEVANVFEANKSYTFSVWAQSDVLLGQTIAAGLYIFDGSVAFNPIGTGFLASNSFNDPVINHRTAAMTAVQSQANWGQLSLSHTVTVGAPEIGHPIGVAFRGFRDTAVDDATLTVVDAITQVLYLEVNTTNGTVRLRNQTGATVSIDYYEITGPNNSLNPSWAGFQNANPALSGFPQGNGTGNGWEKAGGTGDNNSDVLAESYLTSNSAVVNSANLPLGTAFNVGSPQLLQFKYGAILTPSTPPTGDYNNNGVVDTADYVLWRDGGALANDPTPGNQPGDYGVWRANFGSTSVSAPSTLVSGAVVYVSSAAASAVPEPSTVLLVGMGLAVVAGIHRRKKSDA
jgi:hypothetical protein